jgi:malto-oligosyltrehalose trehalohydrolase
MPFGAQTDASGVTRFRLWAPAAHEVSLLLARANGAEHAVNMQAHDAAWFEANVPAPTGTRYCFRIDGGSVVPDPASRRNPDDVHGSSEVVDPLAFDWEDAHWTGRRWAEAVIYELHVGTFSPEGTFAGVEARLDHLAALGVTAIELMPVAQFAGGRGWGYDGVLPFAPQASYGAPDDLKRMVQAAHRRGLMVIVDAVYNHFGPEGNYLRSTAPAFFTAGRATPWGDAINFDGPGSATVREFFMHNALYWLEEFGVDGLRLDAVHAIFDDSTPDFVDALAASVRRALPRRHVHLILENDANAARRLGREPATGALRYDAQWNDDLHHALHVLVTGETGGYYADFARDPLARLGRCLAEGFADQGEASPFRQGRLRGEPSAHLPPTAFVAFLQDHDQVGNRAFGERIFALAPAHRVAVALAIVLLAPSIPMLFMGDEFAAATPFLYFCNFAPALAPEVDAGRRREFAQLPDDVRARIPRPDAEATFLCSKLDWDCLTRPPHTVALAWTQRLLALRARHIVPLIDAMDGARPPWQRLAPRALRVDWPAGDATLWMLANLGDDAVAARQPRGALVCRVGPEAEAGTLAAWSAVFGVDAERRT